jgi:hypothetical protein
MSGISVLDVVAVATALRFDRSGCCGTWPLSACAGRDVGRPGPKRALPLGLSGPDDCAVRHGRAPDTDPVRETIRSTTARRDAAGRGGSPASSTPRGSPGAPSRSCLTRRRIARWEIGPGRGNDRGTRLDALSVTLPRRVGRPVRTCGVRPRSDRSSPGSNRLESDKLSLSRRRRRGRDRSRKGAAR